jgi:hypothetical protein
MEFIEAGVCTTIAVTNGVSFNPGILNFPFNRIAFFTGNTASDLLHMRLDGQAAISPASLNNTPGYAYLLRDVITPTSLTFKEMQDSNNIRLFHTAAAPILVTIMLLRTLQR